ncbi:SRPBCC family protein [Nannocystaceae bacterium ST9]
MTRQDQPEDQPETTRSHENTIEIDAPPHDVWRALSEGEELARWFAVQAEVAPGEGGSWKVSWDESPVQTYALIAAWEPLRRLRLVHDPSTGSVPSRLAEEFEIEALEGGRCRLRIVASGFSTDAAWDGEFEGTKTGWAVFLRNLRFYLERQRGKPSASAGVPWRSTLPRAQAFAGVFGRGGVLDCEGQPRVEGGTLSLRAHWGETIEATIDMARGDAMLGLVIGDMLLRAEFVELRSGPFIHVMLLAWGDARERMADLHAKIAAALAEVLPQPPTLSSDA